MSWIQVKDFSYTYPGDIKPTLDTVNLSLEMGTFAVLCGESGSGKSTLGKALAGFLFADEDPKFSGEIIVNGVNMTRLPLFLASERVAYVQQNPEDQFCTLTVEDEIAFGLENYCLNPIIIEQRIEKALRIVQGMDLKNRELHTLSGGEKQKVAIASFLAIQPDVLILDEPTSNLDPISTQNIFETLHNLRQSEEMTVIIIEHKLDQLLELNPILLTLNAGKITEGYQPAPSVQKESHLSNLLNLLPQTKTENAKKAPVVEMTHACVDIKGHEILHDLDLALFPGEFIALMGPNGSGKSTLLRTLMGFHKLSSGRCNLFGKNGSKLSVSDLVPDIGFIFQNPDHQLFTQSVWDEATLTARNISKFDDTIKQKTIRWLDLIGLGNRHEDHPQRLSYGQKRRINLVASLLHEPQLILIDELLIGQDPNNAILWMDFLKKISNLGFTVLLAIHQPDLTRKYCDRVIFLEEGQILINDNATKAFNRMLEYGYHAFLPKFSQEVAHG